MRETLHIAIIGGGAAGFFAAISAKCSCPDADIVLFEKNTKVLAKVEVTGGGRCNLTNSFDGVTDLKQVYPRGHQLIKRLFRQFDYQAAYRWFENHGVPLVTQEDQCVFPQAQDSHAVIACLTNEAARLGVRVFTGHRLTAVERKDDGRYSLLFDNGSTQRQMVFERVVVTTGGHPRKESFAYLTALGHKIEEPVPSLFTFNVPDRTFRALMGTVVDPVTVMMPGTKFRAEGPLLVTHWGMSGPAILKLSSHAARYLHEHDYRFMMAVNWVHESNRAVVEENIRKIVSANPQKQMATLRPYGLPSRLWLYLLQKTGFVPEKKWAEVGRKGINQLVETLTNDAYQVSGKSTFKEEFVTCGGISLTDVDKHTLESKVCPGMYFAGEVLDIDAVTGGFNLQAAWTTGWVVGQHLGKVKR